jgi:hypothetical protein
MRQLLTNQKIFQQLIQNSFAKSLLEPISTSRNCEEAFGVCGPSQETGCLYKVLTAAASCQCNHWKQVTDAVTIELVANRSLNCLNGKANNHCINNLEIKVTRYFTVCLCTISIQEIFSVEKSELFTEFNDLEYYRIEFITKAGYGYFEERFRSMIITNSKAGWTNCADINRLSEYVIYEANCMKIKNYQLKRACVCQIPSIADHIPTEEEREQLKCKLGYCLIK